MGHRPIGTSAHRDIRTSAHRDTSPTRQKRLFTCRGVRSIHGILIRSIHGIPNRIRSIHSKRQRKHRPQALRRQQQRELRARSAAATRKNVLDIRWCFICITFFYIYCLKVFLTIHWWIHYNDGWNTNNSNCISVWIRSFTKSQLTTNFMLDVWTEKTEWVANGPSHYIYWNKIALGRA